MPILPAATALAAAHQDRDAPLIEVRFAQREGLVDPRARAPEHDDERPQSLGVQSLPACRDGDDLGDRGWVGRVPLALLRGERPA